MLRASLRFSGLTPRHWRDGSLELNQIPESSYDYLFAVLKALSELKPAGGKA